MSELLGWTIDHLIAGATQMEATADRWETIFMSMSRDVHTVDWHGEAADAARLRLTSDKTQVSLGAEKLRAGANVARAGASDVLSAQNQLRYAIEDAQQAGFNVYDDCTVEDIDAGGGATRQAQAKELATKIYSRARHLVGVDKQVSHRLNQTVGDIGNYFNFDEADNPATGRKPEVHLVDHKTGGDSGSIRNSDDVHRRVDLLPPGKNRRTKVVDTNEEIRLIYEQLTENATRIPSGTYTGEWQVLEDGTKIGYRPNSEFGGSTVDIWYPGENKPWGIHLRERPEKEPLSIGALIITLIAGLGSLATAPHLVGH